MKMVNYLRIWCGIILVVTILTVMVQGISAPITLFMFFLCSLFGLMGIYLLKKEKNKRI